MATLCGLDKSNSEQERLAAKGDAARRTTSRSSLSPGSELRDEDISVHDMRLVGAAAESARTRWRKSTHIAQISQFQCVL